MTTAFIDPALSEDRIPGETVSSLRHGLKRFASQDDQTFWMIDYRNPAGFTPLALTHLELAYCRASQVVAQEGLNVGSDGFAVRLLGPFCYTAEEPMANPADLPRLAQKYKDRLKALPDDFVTQWQAKRAEIIALNQDWQRLDLSTLTGTELANTMDKALAHALRLWTDHFRLMYPLLGLQSSFLSLIHI